MTHTIAEMCSQSAASTITAREWLAAINAAYPDRPVSLRTVYHWLKNGTAPDWALKLRSK